MIKLQVQASSLLIPFQALPLLKKDLPLKEKLLLKHSKLLKTVQSSEQLPISTDSTPLQVPMPLKHSILEVLELLYLQTMSSPMILLMLF